MPNFLIVGQIYYTGWYRPWISARMEFLVWISIRNRISVAVEAQDLAPLPRMPYLIWVGVDAQDLAHPPQPISGTASAVEAQDLAPLPQPKSYCGSISIPKIPSWRKSTDDTTPYNKFGPQSKNLASIIRGFKIGVTINAKQSGIEFGWQPRYYDHIIRNLSAYNRITNYIENNPLNWKGEKGKDFH